MQTLIDFKLVRLDDGQLKAVIRHDGVRQEFHKKFESAEQACEELSRIVKMLPSQAWFREIAEG